MDKYITATTKVLTAEAGIPYPLGATQSADRANFAVHVRDADRVALSLYPPDDVGATVVVLPNRTGTIWHGTLPGDWSDHSYTFLITRNNETQELLDPYAKLIEGPSTWGDKGIYRPRGRFSDLSFDWQGVEPPRHDPIDLIIYEMHIRGFTADPSSGVAHPGTYLGLIEKIPYLKELGVTAVELLPSQEFWEGEYQVAGLCNYWGYSTVNFFSPMTRYASDPKNAIAECQLMVRELHRAGIEVILDVVYNHTSEGDNRGPTLSCRGLDPKYYLLSPEGGNLNFSGCGNTFNCNYPIAQDLILDSIRHWATVMGIDGFRFDLATILGRGEGGEPLTFSPLIDRISLDPVLADTKLIAEAWDAGGLYQVGDFFPQYGRWLEWNGHYRDIARRFVKGDSGQSGSLATAVCGSQDLYHWGSPSNSVNFITAHDGFSLRDLMSYNEKHNEANGEENRDGSNDNESWNCGIEGETEDPEINAIRERQQRNALAVLLLSQGIPMFTMGDEMGHTKNGNNNTWCQDNELNWFQWDTVKTSQPLLDYTKKLIACRKENPLFQADHFFSEGEILWHGNLPEQPTWDYDTKLVSWSLPSGDLFVAFHAGHETVTITPPTPLPGNGWFPLGEVRPAGVTLTLEPFSHLVLETKPLN